MKPLQEEEAILKRQPFIFENRLHEFPQLKGMIGVDESKFSIPRFSVVKSSVENSQFQQFKTFRSTDSFTINTPMNVFTNNEDDLCVQEQLTADNNTDFPYFYKLVNLLKKHFHGLSVSDRDHNLSDHEIEIMKAIVDRKYRGLIKTPIATCFINELLKEIEHVESCKRPEENYKFIFKRCIKFLKERLYVHSAKKLRKRQLDEYFFEHYFTEVCKQQNISMDLFRHPRRGQIGGSGPKTVSIEYIRTVAKSREFVKDFNSYMYRHLQTDYEEAADHKIYSMIKKWEETYANGSDRNEATKTIVEYILKNKKCKLPWNHKEIETAMETVRVIFADCRESQ